MHFYKIQIYITTISWNCRSPEYVMQTSETSPEQRHFFLDGSLDRKRGWQFTVRHAPTKYGRNEGTQACQRTHPFKSSFGSCFMWRVYQATRVDGYCLPTSLQRLLDPIILWWLYPTAFIRCIWGKGVIGTCKSIHICICVCSVYIYIYIQIHSYSLSEHHDMFLARRASSIYSALCMQVFSLRIVNACIAAWFSASSDLVVFFFASSLIHCLYTTHLTRASTEATSTHKQIRNNENWYSSSKQGNQCSIVFLTPGKAYNSASYPYARP